MAQKGLPNDICKLDPPKKIIGIPNQPKKSTFSTLKVYMSQNFVWGLLDGIRPGSIKNN
jgi:hypothetical protein